MSQHRTQYGVLLLYLTSNKYPGDPCECNLKTGIHIFDASEVSINYLCGTVYGFEQDENNTKVII